eukprot:2791743-Rhodomonas_salina.4
MSSCIRYLSTGHRVSSAQSDRMRTLCEYRKVGSAIRDASYAMRVPGTSPRCTSPYAISVPDFAQHTRREIAPYAISLPDIAQHTRRYIAPYAISVPYFAQHTRREMGADLKCAMKRH